MRPTGPNQPFLRANRRSGQRASTLIELLVVISIIGFLFSLLIPSLKKSTEMAAATVCRHHLRELGRGLEMYRMENDGWLPAGEPASSNSIKEVKAEPWFGKLYPTHLPDPMVLRCPRDPYGPRVASASGRTRDQLIEGYASYGLNDFLMTVGGGRFANVDRNLPRRPADTILAADLGPDDVGIVEGNGTIVAPARKDSLLMWSDGFDPFSDNKPNPWLTTRHGDGIHMLTLVGEVRDVRTSTVLRTPMLRRYPSCAAGGCTLCMSLKLYHYSFAKDQLFWWTGPVPPE